MNRTFIRLLVAALVAAPLLFGVAAAQKPVSIADIVTETFTIEAIDHTARVVTLKDKDGLLEDIYCGPDVQRFDALKIGDKVTFRYHESLVSAIRRPGTGARPTASGAVTRTPGAKPGGTIAQQMSAIVTIQAIDLKAPSVRVKLEGGRETSFRIENAKNLEGYKVGDRVEITYTQALAISVTPGGK